MAIAQVEDSLAPLSRANAQIRDTLEALEKVLASGLTDPTLLAEANAAGIEASKAGLQALAELPKGQLILGKGIR